METNSTTPATKPQPVVVLGAATAAATTIVGGLTALFADNPTVVLVLGVCSVVIGGITVFKDQYVKSQVVPASDVVAYANDDRQVVTGPAAPGPDGEIVHDLVMEAGQQYHDGGPPV